MKPCKLCGSIEYNMDLEQDICVECWKHLDCCGLEKL